MIVVSKLMILHPWKGRCYLSKDGLPDIVGRRAESLAK